MTINERVSDEPMTHELKIYPEFFSAVVTGVKRAELRKNDRDYRVGDKLHLMETPRGSCHSTGEYINATITHIADVNEWMPGYVLLSIERELQQHRAAAEPVCPKCGGTGMADSGGVQPWGEPIFIECDCHAAPQLPQPAPVAVPDEMEMDDDFDSAFEHGKAVGWNACRAAMLAAPAVQAEQTISADYLQGHKDGCEWSARMAEANHPQTSDWLFDDPIELAKAIRKGPDMLPVEPGNSPVIQDGWTGSDKANAALVMLDRIDTVDPVDDDRIEGIKRIIRELAAAPKQEAE